VSCFISGMARKMNLQKLAQETRGQAEILSRQPEQPAALYFLRLPRPKVSVPSKRRFQISIDGDMREVIPQSVKIKHGD